VLVAVAPVAAVPPVALDVLVAVAPVAAVPPVALDVPLGPAGPDVNGGSFTVKICDVHAVVLVLVHR